MKNIKNYKYNYIYIIYDIKEERVTKVFKICKKYLEHYQNSVFRGEISDSNLIKLKKELKETINENEDNILILYYFTKESVIKEELGIKNKGSNFL